MKKNLCKVAVLIAVCALTLGGEAIAGKGGGKGLQAARGGQSQAQAQAQGKVRQQLKTGDCTATGVPQGSAQGSRRQLGLADGSELAPRPQDGTGFGRPAN